MRAGAPPRKLDGMTATTDPTPASVGQPTEPRRRPWAWIAVCAVLAIVIVGVTIWALGLQSDLDHQRDQTAAAQQQADKAASEVDQLSQDVDDAIDQAGQSGAAAKEKLQGALADLKARLDGLAGETTPPAAPPSGSAP